MLEISDRRIGEPLIFKPLPPHPSVSEVVLDALPVLDPPSRMTVTDASERYVRIQAQGNWQGYDRGVTPYMVEPQDVTTSRRFKVVAVTAPSQCGKTQMLQNTALHRVTCDPMPVLVIHMTKTDRDKWVEEKFNRQIHNSPAIRERLGKGRDDDTFGRKRFKGMNIAIGFPTPTALSGDSRGLVLLTDYDHFPEVLGPKDRPEGSPLGMARQRIRSFLSRGCVLVESSIAFPQDDPSWHPTPEAPHMLPPTKGGIALVYNDGTRGRWYWECPDCGDEFEPRFDRLVYDEALSPVRAADGAEMQCPHCGSLIAHRHKVELNRATLTGRGGWRHETDDGQLCAISDGGLRRTDIASFALNGAAAVFVSWRELVANYLLAKRKFEQLHDSTDLAQVHYTEIGVPFSLSSFGDDEIGLQFLKDNAQATERRTAPAWARYLTVSVDVQRGRFVVQITAWGLERQGQAIDRFDLVTPPTDAPDVEIGEEGATRALNPAKYAEDWAVLDGLLDRIYPVEGAEYGLRPMAAAVDFHGEPGVSDNAELFWRRMKKAGLSAYWFVSRGHGGFKVLRRVWYEAPERAAKGKKARAIKILNMATDRLKDTVWAMVGRADGSGEGAFYASAWEEDEHLQELVSEQRGDKGWEKRPGVVRNEKFDLTVQARALAEHKGMMKIDPSSPPPWAEGGPSNPFAVSLSNEDGEAATAPTPASRRPRRLF